MENNVPDISGDPAPDSPEARLAQRSLGRRYDAYRAEVRRLMSAASDLMQRTGSVDPRVGEIVGAAGLSNQAFYRHFRGKDELLAAILEDGLQTLLAYLEHRMQGASDPLGRAREWIEGVLAQALDPRAARATRPFVSQRARLAERFPEQSAAWIDRVQRPLRDAIAEAKRAGALPAADPARDADAVYHLVMGWVERCLAQERVPSREDAEHVLRFALQGLTRAGESPRGA